MKINYTNKSPQAALMIWNETVGSFFNWSWERTFKRPRGDPFLFTVHEREGSKYPVGAQFTVHEREGSKCVWFFLTLRINTTT